MSIGMSRLALNTSVDALPLLHNQYDMLGPQHQPSFMQPIQQQQPALQDPLMHAGPYQQRRHTMAASESSLASLLDSSDIELLSWSTASSTSDADAQRPVVQSEGQTELLSVDAFLKQLFGED